MGQRKLIYDDDVTDIWLTLNDIPVRVSIPETVKCVRLIPEGREIAFSEKGGAVEFTLPEVTLYQGAEILY